MSASQQVHWSSIVKFGVKHRLLFSFTHLSRSVYCNNGYEICSSTEVIFTMDSCSLLEMPMATLLTWWPLLMTDQYYVKTIVSESPTISTLILLSSSNKWGSRWSLRGSGHSNQLGQPYAGTLISLREKPWLLQKTEGEAKTGQERQRRIELWEVEWTHSSFRIFRHIQNTKCIIWRTFSTKLDGDFLMLCILDYTVKIWH